MCLRMDVRSSAIHDDGDFQGKAMEKYRWHLYYSGADVVDANEAWASEHDHAGICPDCGNYMPGNEGDFAVVMDQLFLQKQIGFLWGAYRRPSCPPDCTG